MLQRHPNRCGRCFPARRTANSTRASFPDPDRRALHSTALDLLQFGRGPARQITAANHKKLTAGIGCSLLAGHPNHRANPSDRSIIIPPDSYSHYQNLKTFFQAIFWPWSDFHSQMHNQLASEKGESHRCACLLRSKVTQSGTPRETLERGLFHRWAHDLGRTLDPRQGGPPSCHATRMPSVWS